jgi:hypothetical protein
MKLIDILKENINEAEAEQTLEKGLEAALKDLKSTVSTVKPSPKDKELEEGLATLYSLVVGAPGLLNIMGHAADALSSYLSQGMIPKTKIGAYLRKLGHKWEHKYIEWIGLALKKAYPKSYGDEDVFDEKSNLHKAAHGLYAALLAAGIIGAGISAVEATNAVIKGLEGGAVALKFSELEQLAAKIA